MKPIPLYAHLTEQESERIIQPEKRLSLAGRKIYLKEEQANSGLEIEQYKRTGQLLGKERLIEKAKFFQKDLKTPWP